MTTVAYRVARELFHKTCIPPGERATSVVIDDPATRCSNCDQPLGETDDDENENESDA